MRFPFNKKNGGKDEPSTQTVAIIVIMSTFLKWDVRTWVVFAFKVRRIIFWHVRLEVSRFGVTPVSSRLYNWAALIPCSTRTFSKEARWVVRVLALKALHLSSTSLAGRPRRILSLLSFRKFRRKSRPGVRSSNRSLDCLSALKEDAYM